MIVENSPSRPYNWCVAELSEVCLINPTVDKAAIADDTEVSFVPMPAVQACTGAVNVSETRKFGSVKKGYTPFREGDVLFAKITPCMENGKMAVAPPLKNGLGFGSTEFHVLRTHAGISPQYVYYYVSSASFRREAEHNMSGAVGQRRVTTPYLSACKLPLPAASEQLRIVAKLEELFSEMDNGIESLTTARAQLKVYRQALLKHAFEGKLTEQWRTERFRKGELGSVDTAVQRLNPIPRPNRWNSRSKDTIVGHSILAVGNPGTQLPEGWRWVQLVDIAQMESGHTPSRSHPEWWGGDIPWISIPDARRHHRGVIADTPPRPRPTTPGAAYSGFGFHLR